MNTLRRCMICAHLVTSQGNWLLESSLPISSVYISNLQNGVSIQAFPTWRSRIHALEITEILNFWLCGTGPACRFSVWIHGSLLTTEGNITNTNQQMSSGQKIISSSHVVCICLPMAMEH